MKKLCKRFLAGIMVLAMTCFGVGNAFATDANMCITNSNIEQGFVEVQSITDARLSYTTPVISGTLTISGIRFDYVSFAEHCYITVVLASYEPISVNVFRGYNYEGQGRQWVYGASMFSTNGEVKRILLSQFPAGKYTLEFTFLEGGHQYAFSTMVISFHPDNLECINVINNYLFCTSILFEV